jgi:magnesium-transporting ATPase (P-type)
MPSITDLLYAFTEWLRTTSLVEFSLWISNLPISLWIGTNFFVIPIMQCLHILAIAASFSSVLMINLRILGLTGTNRTMNQVVRRYLPWIWWSLAVLILTGIGMIVGEPIRELINPIFWIKMVLVIAVILLSIWFQAKANRHSPSWNVKGGAIGMRAGAVGIILLWCAVMAGGRWIAYAPV